MQNKEQDESMLEELFEDFSGDQKKKDEPEDSREEKTFSKNKQKHIIILSSLLIAILLWYYLYLNNIQNIDNNEDIIENQNNNESIEVWYEDENINNNEVVVDTLNTDYSIVLKAKYKKLYSLLSDISWQVNSETDFSNVWWDENIEELQEWGLKISYPKGSYKPSADPRWWAGFIYHIGQDYKTLQVSYDLEFAPNFLFVKWGKLPWLCWGDCARGWENAENGFSIRFAWKKDWYLDTLISVPWASKFWSK